MFLNSIRRHCPTLSRSIERAWTASRLSSIRHSQISKELIVKVLGFRHGRGCFRGTVSKDAVVMIRLFVRRSMKPAVNEFEILILQQDVSHQNEDSNNNKKSIQVRDWRCKAKKKRVVRRGSWKKRRGEATRVGNSSSAEKKGRDGQLGSWAGSVGDAPSLPQGGAQSLLPPFPAAPSTVLTKNMACSCEGRS